jgi:hypothetical protein
MVTRKSSLSKGDIRDILAHIKACSDVIEKHSGEMSVMEIMFKSTLGALEKTLNEQLKLREGEKE